MMDFSNFLPFSTGCCTVAALFTQPGGRRWHRALGYKTCENLENRKSANDGLRDTLRSKGHTGDSTADFPSGSPHPSPCERQRTETPQPCDACTRPRAGCCAESLDSTTRPCRTTPKARPSE